MRRLSRQENRCWQFMCTVSIKRWLWLVFLLTACRSLEVLQVQDDNCQSQRYPLRRQSVVVLVSYPWCRGCLEQVSGFLAAQEWKAYKPVYIVRNALPHANSCLQRQLILQDARSLFPMARPLRLYADSLSALPKWSGINLCFQGQWLRHDSLFSGMHMDSFRVAAWLRACAR